MYAVIRTGGKQYRVEPNDVIEVERLPVEAGATLEIAEVLALGGGDATRIGTPLVDGARVAATVVEHRRGEKVIIFKKRRRKNYRRRTGHRQNLTLLRIDGISGP
ncbi:MAG: 50S ribosomal protein L21 [Alphaproteobacteria bacterium]